MMADARVQAVRACARQLAPLSLLTLVNFFNYLDRQIVYGMLSLIGDDFALTKVQMGWLGTANLLVFAALSLIMTGLV